MKGVNLNEKVSQLFISKNPNNITEIESFIKEGIGGFMIGEGGEITSQKQADLEGDNKRSLKRFVKNLKKLTKKHNKIPLFLAIDGEGGYYFNRLQSISTYKSARYYGKKFEKNKNISFFKKETKKFAKLMKKIGINMNFAPVVDCAKKGYKGYMAEEKNSIKKEKSTNSESFASNRAYSDEMGTVITLGLTAMKVFQKYKIIPTLKHFPSYGILNKDENPHTVLTISKLPKTKIIKQITPYKRAISLGCYAIMKGHIITALDKEKPASLSIKTDHFLRKTLGFNGLSVIDEVNMGALKEYYNKKDKRKLAIDALKVNDIILTSNTKDFILMRNAILEEAHKSKQIKDKIDESYKRIIYYKKIIGLIPNKNNLNP